MKKIIILLILFCIGGKAGAQYYQRTSLPYALTFIGSVHPGSSVFTDLEMDFYSPQWVQEPRSAGYGFSLQLDTPKGYYWQAGWHQWTSRVITHSRLLVGYHFVYDKPLIPYAGIGIGYSSITLLDETLREAVVVPYQFGIMIPFDSWALRFEVNGFADLRGDLLDGGSQAVEIRGPFYSVIDYGNLLSIGLSKTINFW